MNNLKTTLVTTVLNEEASIVRFIESVTNQSMLLDEIIIVDGGSKDNTVAKILEFKSKYKNKLNLTVFVKKGNRSVGRNEGIKKAKGNIILSSDSGCILDKNWVKEITKPFKDQAIEVVAGYYKGAPSNVFQKSLIPFVLVMEDKIKDKEEFLPATRSMAFKKSIWQKIGGFDEKLSHNEDYSFANNLKIAGTKMTFAKNAVVEWIPRNNLKQSSVMFFRFALGDVQANIFREKVSYIFLRYIFGMYLILLAVIMRSMLLNSFILLLLAGYTAWSIKKNYRYVKKVGAFVFLPLLQFVSDVAVIAGTTLGLLQKVSLKKAYALIASNRWTCLIILLYTVSILSVISFGIPNSSHPFDYFMDEWHQSQSVRDLFKLGSPNIAGAANGSIFQFFLTGIYLLPFYALRIVDPFAIKSAVTNLSMQTALFEVLRLNTLLFGVLSAIVLGYIAKRFYKISAFFTVFLFIFNPLWIALSNYFKYDIALEFWLLLAFLFMLRFVEKQKMLDFIVAGIFSALALATKLEPFNLLAVYVVVFLLFTSNLRKRLMNLFWGLAIYLTTFIAFGIPDIILGKGNLYGYLTSNLLTTPNEISKNLNLGMSYWQYFVEKLYPATFGGVFYFGFLLLSLIGIVMVFKYLAKRRRIGMILSENNYLIVLLLSLISYVLIIISLRTGAVSNRLIPLLPFMTLIVVLVMSKLYEKMKSSNLRIPFLILVSVLLFIQLTESLSWNTLKFNNNPRAISSFWITQNISKGSMIGIENIPIYQSLPDIILNEFYLNQYGKEDNNKYKYIIINSKNIVFPKTVVLSDNILEANTFFKSDKKLIVQKLENQGYKRLKTFYLSSTLFFLFNNQREYYMSGLVQLPVAITVYEK